MRKKKKYLHRVLGEDQNVSEIKAELAPSAGNKTIIALHL